MISRDHQTSEVRVISVDQPLEQPRLVAKRITGQEYTLDHQENHFIILTNVDDAEDFKIVLAPIDSPGRENWTELVPHKLGRLILDIDVFQNYLVRLERENGLPRIVIHRVNDGFEHQISFEEEAYSLGLDTGFEYDTSTIRFSYSSMTTPSQIYDYDMETQSRTLRKVQEVPSGHNSDDYVTKRIFALCG